MKLEHETRYGTLKVFVTAPAGTHHSTIAAAALKYVRSLERPEYVSTPAGVRPVVSRPGAWCTPTYSGPFKLTGAAAGLDDSVRKTFSAWPVPAAS